MVVLLSRHLNCGSESLPLLIGMVLQSLPVFPVSAVGLQLLLLVVLPGVRPPVLPLVFPALQLFLLDDASVV